MSSTIDQGCKDSSEYHKNRLGVEHILPRKDFLAVILRCFPANWPPLIATIWQSIWLETRSVLSRTYVNIFWETIYEFLWWKSKFSYCINQRCNLVKTTLEWQTKVSLYLYRDRKNVLKWAVFALHWLSSQDIFYRFLSGVLFDVDLQWKIISTKAILKYVQK